MKFKKALTLIAALSLVVSITACGSNNSGGNNGSANAPANQ
ncbi:amino acid ABC transporter substrate-binding protein, partial [Salmonella enterica subsp. enterica serovar Typhi]|nr:amino acid ABC transporter substrate-binding protein [Salmonella enterica subsp. enterica serovar Typhi]